MRAHWQQDMENTLKVTLDSCFEFVDLEASVVCSMLDFDYDHPLFSKFFFVILFRNSLGWLFDER